jgi:hypothetical protein
MSETRPPNNPTDIPEDIKEEVKNTIRNAFQLFANQNKEMAQELREFNAKRQEIRGKLKDGANRTTGRIV